MQILFTQIRSELFDYFCLASVCSDLSHQLVFLTCVTSTLYLLYTYFSWEVMNVSPHLIFQASCNKQIILGLFAFILPAIDDNSVWLCMISWYQVLHSSFLLEVLPISWLRRRFRVQDDLLTYALHRHHDFLKVWVWKLLMKICNYRLI